MAQKKIIWTETAARQRRSILEYWLQRNQSNEYPLKLLRLSNEKANQIAANPMLYKAADSPKHAGSHYGAFQFVLQNHRRHDHHHGLLGQPARSQETPEIIRSATWQRNLRKKQQNTRLKFQLILQVMSAI